MSIKISVLACKACKKRTRSAWTFGLYGRQAPADWAGPTCDQFVRFHLHLDGECRGWMGIRREDPLRCPNCGAERPIPMTITATKSDTPCNDRCVTATGDDCQCECGGENHGIYAHGKD